MVFINFWVFSIKLLLYGKYNFYLFLIKLLVVLNKKSYVNSTIIVNFAVYNRFKVKKHLLKTIELILKTVKLL